MAAGVGAEKLMRIVASNPNPRPLRNHARLLLVVSRPQFQRLPQAAQRAVQEELEARRKEKRAA